MRPQGLSTLVSAARPPEFVVTAAQAAQMLGVTDQVLEDMRRRGTSPGFLLLGRGVNPTVLYREAAVLDWRNGIRTDHRQPRMTRAPITGTPLSAGRRNRDLRRERSSAIATSPPSRSAARSAASARARSTCGSRRASSRPAPASARAARRGRPRRSTNGCRSRRAALKRRRDRVWDRASRPKDGR